MRFFGLKRKGGSPPTPIASAGRQKDEKKQKQPLFSVVCFFILNTTCPVVPAKPINRHPEFISGSHSGAETSSA
ncbi:MAG: hypothetical protein A2729_05155 [Candidatus Buchananbacteria bacterium RIFCSPHIGHO2_01_FULL_39_14]|uniref:Uncharacterized protein n=2 Tax=Candidatus Buchananiibacteriota TaxID=1817903 RepID=A0A1G1YRW4_9BACT|nr:MAG: hypothetical protein A2729_05155 [Candidatus Buchananbacteria bacterium RIFCSPHIGHO2_01_FULL_39_14]OGY49132.1 MAG: hypothetical protein A3D39_01775 [Candidatus Buchananbacteria bacterium RIFCSPHIGHO2_02_FULL_39_17]OGY55102.1 MAG: hypothetical protein A2912_00110 [Candidatus Buchananbacteria bacterium RIFCSPLOWO2_01_FULL_40_23b]